MAAKEIIDSVAEAVAEAWGTLFMKTVGLSADDLQAGSEISDLNGEYVAGSLSFDGDVQGTSKVYIPKLEALTMVGMMLSMGADDAQIDAAREGELDADQLDALNEAMNQLSATTATVIREKKSCTINAKVNSCEKIELDGSLPDLEDGDNACVYNLDLEGYDQGQIIQTFSSELVESLDAEGEDPMDALASLGLGSDDDLDSTDSEATSGPQEDADPTLDMLKTKGHLKIKADVVLAERSMEVNQLLSLGIGSVIEFWKPCDDPAELSLNNSTLASGEIVVSQDQHFCIRLVELAPEKKTYQKGVV